MGANASMVFLCKLVGMVSLLSNTIFARATMESKVIALDFGLMLKFTKPWPDAGLVMQVRSAGEPGGANEADHVALSDATALAQTHGKSGKVAVERRITTLVAQDHHFAIAALHADELDGAISSRLDTCADRCACGSSW